MARKPAKRAKKALAANVPANLPATVNPVDQPAQSSQQTNLCKVVATVAPTANSSTQSAPVAGPLKTWEKAAAEMTPTVTTPQTVKVAFVLFEPGAKQVVLCGDFNGWATDATSLKRKGEGRWETTVALAPGRYQYKFVVDGHWIPDPLAHENVWNPHGTLNSVIEVEA